MSGGAVNAVACQTDAVVMMGAAAAGAEGNDLRAASAVQVGSVGLIFQTGCAFYYAIT